jgi:dTDP-4-dehydrorhamnose 3,5-epimerase
MLFEKLHIQGAALVSIERKADARGFFARTFCAEEFSARGIPHEMVQASISYNERRGTIRGMHFQWPPSREDKLVRCIRGRLFDVLLDLRPESPSYLMHQSVVLDEESRGAVFIPHGVAHGFQTLAERTEVLYQMSDFFAPDLGSGLRWNDTAFGIDWPLSEIVISERDAGWPNFDRQAFELELARHAVRAREKP